MKSIFIVAGLLLSQNVFAGMCKDLFLYSDFNPMLHTQFNVQIKGREVALIYGGDKSQKTAQLGLYKAEILKVFSEGTSSYEVRVSIGASNSLIKKIEFNKPGKIPLVVWMKKNHLLIGLSDGSIVSFKINFSKIEPASILPIQKVEGHKGLDPEKQVVLFVEVENSQFPVAAVHFNGNITFINFK